MLKAELILKKHARGEYEIGIQTEDGAVVACVCIWDGTGIDQRTESEREEAAIGSIEVPLGLRRERDVGNQMQIVR